MSTATLPLDKAEIERRFRALGWTQNEMARRIRKDPGLFSRWMRGQLISSIIARRTLRVLDRAEAKRGAA